MATAKQQSRVPVMDEKLLGNREQIIILKASKLHGCIFSPWKFDPTEDEFSAESSIFQDTAEFSFSKEQSEVFTGWRRADSLLTNAGLTDAIQADLVQDLNSDCSLVTSFCVELARVQRLGPVNGSMILSTLYPRKRPSPNGKYVVKLYFNGSFRKVVIDDRLPNSTSDRSLYVVDRNNPNNIWPALIEKAYLKVRGGYDFPGSNSGLDLSILIGWIPEQIILRIHDTPPENLWQRIFKAFNYGDVLITSGTPKMTELEEEDLGLTGQHNYAVLDMKQERSRQFMLVKNPWSGGRVYQGFNYGFESENEDESNTKRYVTFAIHRVTIMQSQSHLYELHHSG